MPDLQYNRALPPLLHDMTDVLIRQARPAATRGRLLPWLILLVFLLQFLGTAQHHHELTAKSPHCVSCTLHAQPHAAPPDTAWAPPAFVMVMLHGLVQAGVNHGFVARAGFLRPPAHGPPATPLT